MSPYPRQNGQHARLCGRGKTSKRFWSEELTMTEQNTVSEGICASPALRHTDGGNGA